MFVENGTLASNAVARLDYPMSQFSPPLIGLPR